jgi:DNA-directed RNA polymerase specialized sigma subunit
LQRFPTGKILSEIFEQVGRPIEFDCLAEIVAAALMIKDLPSESLDQNDEGLGLELIDAGPPPDAHIEEREMLQLMWEEVRRMPAIQRDIVCFKFSDHSGEDFFNLIIRAGIATLKELTEEFGLTPEQLMEIWKRTPMGVEDLARHFGVSRQQVSKLHHRAVIRLLDRLTKK